MNNGSTKQHLRRRGRPQHPDVLTPVEWAISRRVREGLNNAEIAALRGCRADTIKEHIERIIGKLELADRAALVRWRGLPMVGEELPGIDLLKRERRQRMATTSKAGTVTGVAPMFLVDDVARTAEWYRDHLGFDIGEYFREDHGPHDGDVNHPALGEPVFVILNRDSHRLMLGRTMEKKLGVRSNREFKLMSGDAYFWVDGIEAFFEAAKAAGTPFFQEIAMQPYGLLDFIVQDCDGRMITFGGEPTR